MQRTMPAGHGIFYQSGMRCVAAAAAARLNVVKSVDKANLRKKLSA